MTSTDIRKETETETNSALTTDNYNDNAALSYEQSQPEVIDNSCINEKEKVFLDWNANKSSDEIRAGMDRNGDDAPEDELKTKNASYSDETNIYEPPSEDVDHTVAVTELGAVQEQESRVYFSSDEELPTSEERMQPAQNGLTDSAAVAMVTASVSYSGTENADVDAPPPLPISLPPPSSALLPSDHDTSQDLSLTVESDQHSAATVVAASSSDERLGHQTWEPDLSAAKIPETTESEVSADLITVGSNAFSNGLEKTGSESTSAEPKLKPNLSLFMTTTVDGSVVGSFAANENELKWNSSDVKVDAVRSVDVMDLRAVPQAGDPQSPRDRHRAPVSAAAMATELKKMGLKSPTRTLSIGDSFKAGHSDSTSSDPAGEQDHDQHLSQSSPTDKYSTFSEDDRMLVQRMLETIKDHPISATEKTTAAEQTVTVGYADNQSEQKYSELSDSDRMLIENKLASLSHSEPDARSAVGKQNTDTVTELQNQESTDKNTPDFGLKEKTASLIKTKTQHGHQEPRKDMNEKVNYLTKETEKNETSSRIQEPICTKDQEPGNNTSEEIEDASLDLRMKDVSFTDVVIQESSRDQELEKARVATSPSDDFVTSGERSDINAVNNQNEDYEEPTVTTLPEIHETVAFNSKELDSADNYISSAISVPSDDAMIRASGENEGEAVEVNSEVYPETSEVVQSRDGVDEVHITEERRSEINFSGKSSNDVFHSSSSSSSYVPPDAQAGDADAGDALSKSRRTLLSDEAVSGILRDYYTADTVEEQEKAPAEKPKPVKPLIAQALLPRASRRLTGPVNSTALAAGGTSLQTSSSFSSSKPGYHQVEIPRAVILAEMSEVRTSAKDDDQRSKPLIGRDVDDVTNGNVIAPGNVDSDTVRSLDASHEKSANSDVVAAEGHQLPTIAESRAFFQSQGAAVAALMNGSDKTFSDPVTESSSAVAAKFSPATSSAVRPIEVGDTRAVEAELPQATLQTSSAESRHQPAKSSAASSSQTAQPEAATSSSHAEVDTSCEGAPIETAVTSNSQDGDLQTTDAISTASSQPVSLTSSASSLSTSPKVETKVPRLTDARTFFETMSSRSDGDTGTTASKGRVPLIPSTRWAPKPFSLHATATTKPTPGFVTFEPKLPPPAETTESEGFERTSFAAAASMKSKPKRSLSLFASSTADAGGSVVGSSVVDEAELKPKSSDVTVDGVRSVEAVDLRAMPQAGDPQSPRDRHHASVSAAAMATELKKMGLKSPTRTPSLGGFFKAENSSSIVLGRSGSVSQADVQPKSSYGSNSKIRASPSATKSWTQFDYRKTVLPAPAEAAISTVGAQKSRTSSVEVDDGREHISAASSKAFFQAAELAEQQASSQTGAEKIGKKHAPTSSAKVFAPAVKPDEKPSTAAEVELTSSSESSCSTHSAPLATAHGKPAVILQSRYKCSIF